MPATPKTVTDKVKVKALKAFFVDYNSEESKKIEKDFKNGSERKQNFKATGMTKRINPSRLDGEGKEIPAETAEVDKDVAMKLQKAGAVEIIL